MWADDDGTTTAIARRPGENEVRDLSPNSKNFLRTQTTYLFSPSAFLADNKDALADATKSKNSAIRYLAKIEEGLAAEATWWGPAPGNELPAAGQACITFTGRHDLADTKNRDAEYQATYSA